MVEVVPAKQRQFAVEVVRELRARGFQAYWAGGCVRDQLLGRTPLDYDVATNAAPEQITQAFPRRKTLAIGAAFGVITVVGPKGAGQIEVATFRQDAPSSDGRHPDSVAFSSPEEDALRRDFTINGMFYDPLTEETIDFVGGAEDLRDGLLRTIGEPAQRFEEDKLRMLRAIRFAAILNFRIDPATLAAIRDMAEQIVVVSAERIAGEMERMLVAAGRARAFGLLQEAGLLAVILPEIAALTEASSVRLPTSDFRPPSSDPWLVTLALLDALREPSFPLALAALLHSVGDPQVADTIGRRWRLSNHDSQRTGWLLVHVKELGEARQLPWSRLQPLLSAAGADELLDFGGALSAIGCLDEAAVRYCRERRALSPDRLNPPPLLTGADLIAHGVPRGRIYATLLRQIRDAQLDGRITSPAEALTLVDALLKEAGRSDGGQN